jgi:aryl-alcohol dehydrogenase-like predicted oxidoreductase
MGYGDSCEASLRRLWIDSIDLYYLHSSGSASCRTRSLGRGFLTGTPE